MNDTALIVDEITIEGLSPITALPVPVEIKMSLAVEVEAKIKNWPFTALDVEMAGNEPVAVNMTWPPVERTIMNEPVALTGTCVDTVI